MKQAKSIFLFFIITCSFFSFEKINCTQRDQFFVVVGLIGFSYLAYKVISNRFFKDLHNRAGDVINEVNKQEQKNFHEVYPLVNQLQRTPTLFDIKECNSKLVQAVKANDYEATKLWLDRGSKITIEVIIEALKNNINIFKLLIDKVGKDLPQELKNMYLQYAVQIEKNVNLAISLINAKADVNMVDSRDKTLLHLAILENNSEIVDLLIKRGADFLVTCKKKSFFKKDEVMYLFDYLTCNLNSKNKTKKIFAQKCLKCINEALGICSICLENNTFCVELAKTHCGHVFHQDCFNQWLASGSECPVCRLSLYPLLI